MDKKKIIEGAMVIYAGLEQNSLDWISYILDDRRAVDISRLDGEHAYYIRASEAGKNTLSFQIPIDLDGNLSGLARIVITTAADIHAIVEMPPSRSEELYEEIKPELPELLATATRAPNAYCKKVMRSLMRGSPPHTLGPDAVRCRGVKLT